MEATPEEIIETHEQALKWISLLRDEYAYNGISVPAAFIESVRFLENIIKDLKNG